MLRLHNPLLLHLRTTTSTSTSPSRKTLSSITKFAIQQRRAMSSNNTAVTNSTPCNNDNTVTHNTKTRAQEQTELNQLLDRVVSDFDSVDLTTLNAKQRDFLILNFAKLPTTSAKNVNIQRVVLDHCCCFCDPVRTNHGRINTSSRGNFFCLYNLRPVLPGHVLIIPKQHCHRYQDLSRDLGNELHEFMQDTIYAVKKYFAADSYDLIIQEGPHSGQSVRHLHVHILPRRENDIEGEWFDHFQKREHTAAILSVEERNRIAEEIRKCYPDANTDITKQQL
eukprot:GEZU01033564.1.p1 GENE.GEZU01033564.1~~GEZU01033564.1.p1  ORF type:complete len:280 (+),score=30.70 GEZU01033564.1:81-920(+)